MTAARDRPYRELAAQVEHHVSLWGPNSGGGAFLAFADGRVHHVVYGDESTLPDGAEQIRTVETPAEFVARSGDDPRRAPMVAYLRARGLA